MGYCLSIYVTLTIQNFHKVRIFIRDLNLCLCQLFRLLYEAIEIILNICPLVLRWLCLTAHARIVTIPRGREELFPATDYSSEIFSCTFPILLKGPQSSPAETACPVVMPALGLSLYSVACMPRCDACPRVALVLGYLCGYLSKYIILCSCFILLCWLCAQG